MAQITNLFSLMFREALGDETVLKLDFPWRSIPSF
jgi:hypothetical protein